MSQLQHRAGRKRNAAAARPAAVLGAKGRTWPLLCPLTHVLVLSSPCPQIASLPLPLPLSRQRILTPGTRPLMSVSLVPVITYRKAGVAIAGGIITRVVVGAGRRGCARGWQGLVLLLDLVLLVRRTALGSLRRHGFGEREACERKRERRWGLRKARGDRRREEGGDDKERSQMDGNAGSAPRASGQNNVGGDFKAVRPTSPASRKTFINRLRINIPKRPKCSTWII